MVISAKLVSRTFRCEVSWVGSFLGGAQWLGLFFGGIHIDLWSVCLDWGGPLWFAPSLVAFLTTSYRGKTDHGRGSGSRAPRVLAFVILHMVTTGGLFLQINMHLFSNSVSLILVVLYSCCR